MLHKPKILIIDEHEGALDLFDQVINTENEFELFLASKKINAQDVVLKEKPDLALLCIDNSNCLNTADALVKQKDCPPLVLMGKTFENETAVKEIVKKYKHIDTVKLPFEMDEIGGQLLDDSFIAQGMVDDLTELWKKPAFDFKLKKLMNKKTDGVFFCVSLNAYSFAANPSQPLQIQMAVFALKKRFSDALLGISGNIVLGFLSTDQSKKEIEKPLNEAISEMLEAAEKPVIYIPAGACESRDGNYSPEDMLILADRAMEYSGKEGKNKVRFYN